MCLATVYKESDDSVIFKNVSLDHSLISHNITENQFIPIHIYTGNIFNG